MFDNQPIIPLVEIEDQTLKEKDLRLFIKREDLLHPFISGNKWRKLKYNLIKAREEGKTKILTFGGAYSNHIHAVAAAGREFCFETVGVIRGEEHLPLNSTLQFATSQGMHLFYLDRSSYREKYSYNSIAKLRELFGDFFLVPEGGSNLLAVKGCAEIIPEISVSFDYICCACGTGGTLAGIIAGLEGKGEIIGFSSLKGEDQLSAVVKDLVFEYRQATYDNWNIIFNYHFGGYAKLRPELVRFINEFYQKYNILLDPIYTGKMMYGIFDLIKKDNFTRGSTIVAIHTGGIQGIKGMNERYGEVFIIPSV